MDTADVATSTGKWQCVVRWNPLATQANCRACLTSCKLASQLRTSSMLRRLVECSRSALLTSFQLIK